jgi:DNA-directed RNA polymerase specialized sigma24 family protein
MGQWETASGRSGNTKWFIMKYVISNLSIIPTEREKQLFVEQVERLRKKLMILPNHYVDSEKLKINISKINNFEYRLTCSLKLKNGLVFLTESGKDITGTANVLFDKFRYKLATQLEKNRLWHVKNRKDSRQESIGIYREELEELYENKDTASFKSLVRDLLPGLERYVQRMLDSAKHADLLSKGDITPDDIVDEIILRTFRIFEQMPEKAEDMNIWMMQETDNVLNELIDESKYADHATSIEDLYNSELASMQERYTLDSSGDPIMFEDLDEYEYPESLLGIEEAYLVSGSEKETVDKISDNLSRRQMKELIRNELVNLPLRHQAVYDLFFFEQTSVEEIALIKSETPERIEEIIQEVKDYLMKKLKL